MSQKEWLPNGWVIAKVGDYLFLKNGFAFKSNSYVQPNDVTYPVIRISDIDGMYASDADAIHVSDPVVGFEVCKGDLLIAMSGATTGKIGVYKGKEPAFQNQRVGNLKLRSDKLGSTRFRNYLIASLSENILKEAYGGAQPNISGKAIENMEIQLPPLVEQKIIADKLDTLLAQVESIKARLESIPEILKQFRQSVLAAAVSGKLTEEWNVQACLLSDVAEFQNGYAFKSEWFSNAGSYQVIKLGNIRDGRLFVENAPAYVDGKIGQEFERFKPSVGDTLISMTGTRFKQDYGFGCLVETNQDILINQRVGRLIPLREKIIPEFLNLFIRSELFRRQFFQGETGGVNQGNVGSKHIISLSIDVPRIEIQIEVVNKVVKALNAVTAIEEQVQSALDRVNNLTQSILAKAFCGELTAEWREANPDLISGENSAEALLERIKAERSAKPVTKRSRGKA
ncbi:restriction endonuclease subunit S [Acinetobacter sp. F9]|uniref:restriction endonuclease subunit S n=1 Tax=Acinetobacter sp. F9 TaxID=2853158 RepID=UPI001C472ADC|nr:restriction endonuclease subunit S [Acinetobacter sp. F9]